MTEETANVAEEIQQEEVITPQEESINQSPEESQSQEISDKELNFRKLRESKEQLERENKELKEWVQGQLKPKEESAPAEEEFCIDDDDLVDGKVAKRLYNELKELKKFKASYEQEKVASIPDRLRNKFEDFDQVVTQENVEKLKHSEPELYASITAGSDLYGKGVSAYKTLKALGIVKDDPYKADKQKVENNSSRPVSAQAIKGQGALSDANAFAQGLTPELKKQLQQEMSQAVKAR